MRITLFPAAVAAFVSVLFVSCNKAASSASATPDPVKEEVEAQGLEYVAIPAGMDLIGDIGSKASGEEVWDEGVGFWVMDEAGEWIPDEGAAGADCDESFAGTGAEAQNAPADASGSDLTPPYQPNCALPDGAPVTKSYFNGNTVYWAPGDAVSVYDDGYGDEHVFSIKEGAGTASVTLSGGVCQGSRTLWAVSPSSNSSSFNLGTQTLTVTVPSTQQITSDDRPSCAAAMVAVAKITRHATTGAITGNSKFKHVCGFLKFRFGVNTVKRLVLSSMNDENLAGTVEVTFSGEPNSETITLGDVTGVSKTITVTPPSGSTTFTSGTQYVVAILGKSTIGALSYKYTIGSTDFYGKITFGNGGLTKGKGYYGNSTTPMEDKGQDKMSVLTATAATVNSITLSWKNSSSATAPVRYKIEYDADEASISAHSAWIDSPGTGATATRTISGLTSGQEYSFRVRAYASDGTTPLSGWSPVKKQMTQLPTPTVTVTGTKATGYDVACSCTGAATFNIGVTGSGSYTKAAANYTASDGEYTLSVTNAPRNTTGLVATVTASNSSYDVPVSSSTTGSGRCGYFNGGAGTSESPFDINNKQDIYDLARYCSAGAYLSYAPVAGTNAAASIVDAGDLFRDLNYAQSANIGSSSDTLNFLRPIGYSGGAPFRGRYNGNNHSISYYKVTTTNYAGLFGVVGKGGDIANPELVTDFPWCEVKNLKLDHFTPASSGDYADQGAVAGYVRTFALIDNCSYESGAITFIAKEDCGGLVGFVNDYSKVTNCTLKAPVTLSGRRSGGIVGNVNNYSEINYCTVNSSATVRGGGNYSGGIAGYLHNSAKVSHCTCAAAFTGGGTCSGGIAGFIDTSSKVSDCSVTGSVTGGGEKTGGICGRATLSTVEGCSVGAASDTLVVTGGGCYTGGVVGHAESSSIIKDCVISKARVTATRMCTGGFVGLLDGGSSIIGTTTSTSNAQGVGVLVSKASSSDGETSVGGIVGKAENATVSRIYFKSGYVKYTASTDYCGVGGIAGKAGNALIEKCRVGGWGDVKIWNKVGDCVGGIVGQIYVKSNLGVTVRSCQTYGSSYAVLVRGGNMVGGIVGGYNMDEATAKAVFIVEHCLLASEKVKVQGSGAGVGGIMGGTRDTNDNPNKKPYELNINNCYLQATPQIEGCSKADSYASGTAGIIGRPVVCSPSDTHIRICNCCIASGYIYDSSPRRRQIGGLIGYFKGDGGSASSWTLQIFNNAVYLDKIIHPDDPQNDIKDNYIGSVAGLFRCPSGGGGTFVIYGLCTDFDYKYICKGNLSSNTAYGSVPSSNGSYGMIYGERDGGSPSYFRVNYNVLKAKGSWQWYPSASAPSDSMTDYTTFSKTLGSPSDSKTTTSTYGNINYLNQVPWDSDTYSTLPMAWVKKDGSNYAWIERLDVEDWVPPSYTW